VARERRNASVCRQNYTIDHFKLPLWKNSDGVRLHAAAASVATLNLIAPTRLIGLQFTQNFQAVVKAGPLRDSDVASGPARSGPTMRSGVPIRRVD
jgi:hypothetical protein